MAIQDDAKNFLLSALSRAGGDLPSLQLEWLATQGYTRGTIDDRWQAYLSANAYYLPEGLSRLLVGLNRAIGNNWTPNLLFQSGDILLWYDPSDLSTMFKDTAGTQPVTADGDSVALMLDKGQWGGKTLTQVLADPANSVFSDDFSTYADTSAMTAVWVPSNVGGGAEPSLIGGAIALPRIDGSNFARANCAITTVAGLRYTVQFTVASGPAHLNVGTVINSGGLFPSPGFNNGVHQVSFVASGATAYISVNSAANGVTPTLDNISVKEIPGYHRTQATGTSMPKYKTDGTLHWLLYDGTDDGHATGTVPFGTVTSDGAERRNLLVNPTQFDHTTWTAVNLTVSPNTTAAPDGTLTADTITTANVSNNIRNAVSPAVTVGATYTFSFYALRGTMTDLKYSVFDATNLSNIFATNSYYAQTSASAWARISVTFVVPAGCTAVYVYPCRDSGSIGTAFIWGAQLELGSTATDFQNIGTDEVAICAGVTKSSDATSAAFIELSTSYNTNNGSFALFAPLSGTGGAYYWIPKGTTPATTASAAVAAPDTRVIATSAKIGSDSAVLRLNGTEVDTDATDQGTGNFGSYPLYFGRRGGTTLPFNGREYQTVIRSRLLSAAELTKLETFVAAKTGVIL